jgi:hypothetical protein
MTTSSPKLGQMPSNPISACLKIQKLAATIYILHNESIFQMPNPHGAVPDARYSKKAATNTYISM